jgi:hypothetical protein
MWRAPPFDALAILAAATASDTSLAPQRRALAILQPLFAAHPDAHYIIYTCDTPALARDGLDAARRAGLAARAAHAGAHLRQARTLERGHRLELGVHRRLKGRDGRRLAQRGAPDAR